MKMTVKRMGLLPTLLAMVLVFAACSSRTQTNLGKVEWAMTEQQVVKLLGQPDNIDTSSIAGLVSSTYRYESGTNQVIINFVNGRVIRIQGGFENENSRHG